MMPLRWHPVEPCYCGGLAGWSQEAYFNLFEIGYDEHGEVTQAKRGGVTL